MQKKRGIRDMFDNRYIDVELPADFMMNEISKMYQEDALVKVLRESPIVGQRLVSPLVMIDMETMELHGGFKDMDEPFYIPKEDRRGVDMIYDFVKSGCVGIFPDVPIADAGIPYNQYERYSGNYVVQSYFGKKMPLVNASIGCKGSLGHEYTFVDVNDDGEIEEEDAGHDCYFIPFDHTVEMGDLKYIGMQFNPFHPMSISSILEFKWVTESLVKGFYSYRSERVPFSFDLNDKRYRVHSDIWCSLIGYKNGYYESFDLVSNYEFASTFEWPVEDVSIQPNMIEPLIVYGAHNFPYSYLGPDTIVVRGEGLIVFSAYSRCTINMPFQATRFKEVTQDVVVYTDSMLSYQGKDIKIIDKEIQHDTLFMKMSVEVINKKEMKSIYQPRAKGKKAHAQYLSKKKKKIRFRLFQPCDKGDFVFNFVKAKIRSFPRNFKGSIIYTMRYITLDMACKYGSGILKPYLPLWSPMTENLAVSYGESELYMNNDFPYFKAEDIKVTKVDQLDVRTSFYNSVGD